MHEAKLAKYVYEILQETIEEDQQLKDKEIKVITFGQGEPWTVVPDSFEFYFTELVKDTSMKSAILKFVNSDEKGFFITSIEV